MKSSAGETSVYEPLPPFVSRGGELSLSNPGQLELLRAVGERGAALRTKVRGFSMSPFIRDEDVLTIAPPAGRTLCVGDVVAFTRPDTGRLAIHRIVAASDSGWLIRGDNCPEADGIVAAENIIGYVVRVERDGRDVRLGLGPEKAWIARLNRGTRLMRLRRLWYLPRRAAGFVLRSIQAAPFYRFLGRRLAPRVAIAEADVADLEAVHRIFNPHAPYREEPKNPNVVNWVARHRRRVVAFVQYVYHPEAHRPWVGHWLCSLHVRGRYRGLGIGEALTERVLETARNRKASEFLLAVYEDNTPAIRLYRKLGFVPVTLPSLEPGFAAEKEQSGRRRIVLCRTLVEPPAEGKSRDRNH